MGQIRDSQILNPVNGNGLVYNGGVWENKNVATGSITGTNGELVIVDNTGTGIEATTLGSIDATALTLSNTLKVSNNATALGGVTGNISGTPNSTLTIDGNSVSYGFIRLSVPATSTLTTLTATNMRQSGQIIVHIEGSASGTLTIQGSDAGGISGASVNFTADVEVANNQDCLLTLFSSNGKVLISAGKYLN